jgi:hypothetical protein
VVVVVVGVLMTGRSFLLYAPEDTLECVDATVVLGKRPVDSGGCNTVVVALHALHGTGGESSARTIGSGFHRCRYRYSWEALFSFPRFNVQANETLIRCAILVGEETPHACKAWRCLPVYSCRERCATAALDGSVIQGSQGSRRGSHPRHRDVPRHE